MLPMAVGNEPNGNYLEFYQGFLLGLDSVRTKYGHSIDLTLYNTARNVDAIREFVKSDAFAGTGLIVGPVYEEGLHPVILYAEEHDVPVVSPLPRITGVNSDASSRTRRRRRRRRDDGTYVRTYVRRRRTT